MLIRFSVTRKDSGAPVPNARIEVEKAETVGFTDATGKAQITTYVTGFQTAKISKEGYRTQIWDLTITGDADQFVISQLEYNAISPPSTPGFKEEIIGRVGTSCSIINNYSFAKSAYQVRHDRNGNLSSLHMDLQEVQGIANRSSACFETPPPPPKTTDELGAEVSTLQKLLNSTVGKIENLAQGIGDIISKAETEAAEWRKAVDGIWEKLEGWMIERIVGILLKGLDREVEVMKKNGRT